MQYKAFSIVMVAAFLLGGCALVQQNPYTACNGEPLCTAYGTYATVAYSTAYAVRHDTITVARAEEIQAQLHDIHATLDAIRAGSKPETRLATVRAALREIMQALPNPTGAKLESKQ